MSNDGRDGVLSVALPCFCHWIQSLIFFIFRSSLVIERPEEVYLTNARCKEQACGETFDASLPNVRLGASPAQSMLFGPIK